MKRILFLVIALIAFNCGFHQTWAEDQTNRPQPLARRDEPGPTPGPDRLRGRLWRAPSQPRGVILCLHGVQTHSAWFAPLARELNREGWTVFAPDRRGSGLNSEPHFRRGHTTGTRELLGDLRAHLVEARSLAQGRPVILLGTSWGSNLATAYVASGDQPQPDALVQLAPATELQPCFKLNPFKKAGLAVLNLFCPTKTVRLPFGPEHYLAGNYQPTFPKTRARRYPCQAPVYSEGAFQASNQRLENVLANDRMLLQRPTVRTLVSGNKLMKSWRSGLRRAQSIPPILVIVATRDRLMDNAVAASSFPKPPPGNRTLQPAFRVVEAGHGAQVTHPREIARHIARWAHFN
jgi:alpha-beta hydrolase superfamily lysophospholipase